MAAQTRVVVLRALMLGDLLCATPALRALRHGMPGAHVCLLGLPGARELVERLDSVDEFIAFPGWPGLPESAPRNALARQRFVKEMRERHFDLALQMHGSGAIVNPLVAAFGAARNAGFASADAWCPPADAARFVDWPAQGSEVERLLKLTDHLGLARRGTALDFPLRDADRATAAALCAGLEDRPLALIHAGAQLPSRRWPVERFAAVADALAEAGLAIALTGSACTEATLTRRLAAAMHAPALDLSGRTTLWSLAALVERAQLVVCNDTAISHIAAALGTPSVVVSSGGDARRWAPADAARHRVFWHELPCRPCAFRECPIGHPCALAIGVEPVRSAALEAVAAGCHA
jgi:ADP-heptose:LPS heptosyltransferase